CVRTIGLRRSYAMDYW
nr:immunoglobulin heavy chain junction region [Mus musculus]